MNQILLKRIRFVLIAITVLLLAISFFYKNTNVNPNKEKTEKESETESFSIEGNRILLSEETRRTLSVEVLELELSNYSNSIELTGEIQADPDATQSIGTRLPGRIVRIAKKEGEYTRKGELLVVMDSPEVARLRSKYKSSLSRYSTAKKNEERIQELLKMKLSSDQELRNAESEARSWEMEMKADREALTLQGISPDGTGTVVNFYSPISGTILQRFVAPGDIVSANTNFISIGNLNKLWFTAKAFEKDLSWIKIGKKVTVALNAYPQEEFIGRITYTGSVIDPENRTIPARIELTNPSGKLKIGMYGVARINTESKQDQTVTQDSGFQDKTILIPESSLVTIDNISGVFVQLEDMEYEWREVKSGSVRNDMIPVWEGLKQGESIVVKGSYSLKSLFLKSSFGEDE